MISARRPATALSLAAAALLAAPWAAGAAAPKDSSAPPSLSHGGIITGGLNGVRPPPDVAAGAWLVADADTGEILAAKNATAPHRPASTLKVLTALTVAHQLDPQAQVAAPANVQQIDGTRVGLVAGSRYSVHDLLTAMLIASGNDAAQTLADAVGGTAKTLVEMRAEAKRLQAYATVPGTPSGLDAPGQQTTAYDLALIGRAALRDPVVAPYLTVARATLRTPGSKSFEIDSHNPLLGHYPGTIGVKAGYTTLAEATYIGAARHAGHTIIVTLLYAYPRFIPAAEGLLDWGFEARDKVTPLGMLAEPLTDAEIAQQRADATASTSNAEPRSAALSAVRASAEPGGSAVRRRALDALAIFALVLMALRFRVIWLQDRRSTRHSG